MDTLTTTYSTVEDLNAKSLTDGNSGCAYCQTGCVSDRPTVQDLNAAATGVPQPPVYCFRGTEMNVENLSTPAAELFPVPPCHAG